MLKSMDDAVFEFAYQMALDAATRRIKYKGEKSLKERLSNDSIKRKVQEFTNKVTSGEPCIELQNEEKYNKLFDRTIDKITKIDNHVNYGVAQKLINITMKYLYMKFYFDDKKASCFQYCHAPMDSIMRDFVYESFIYLDCGESSGSKPGFTKSCYWSKLNDDDDKNPKSYYESYQKAIGKIMESVDPHNDLLRNRIEFDYQFWDKAKELRDYMDDKKIENKSANNKVSEIWRELGVEPKSR